jgi:WD40 repeat protein
LVIASAGKGGTMRLWDPATGTELLTLRGHSATVNALSFTPGGTLLASGSLDGTIKLWPAERDE